MFLVNSFREPWSLEKSQRGNTRWTTRLGLVDEKPFSQDRDRSRGWNEKCYMVFCRGAGVAEWQTQRTQNPPGSRPCRFDSYLRHQNRCGSSARGPLPINQELERPRQSLRSSWICPSRIKIQFQASVAREKEGAFSAGFFCRKLQRWVFCGITEKVPGNAGRRVEKYFKALRPTVLVVRRFHKAPMNMETPGTTPFTTERRSNL
jgi:hypothetical protein